MSDDDNKDVVRRLLEEVWNGRNADAIDTYYHPDVVEEIREHHAQFLSAFPDMHTTVEELIAEGDLVAARLVIEGTHRGPFGGLAPTGRRVAFVSHRFYRFGTARWSRRSGCRTGSACNSSWARCRPTPARSPGAANAHPRPATEPDVCDAHVGDIIPAWWRSATRSRARSTVPAISSSTAGSPKRSASTS
jgi:predicted ester cyclase